MSSTTLRRATALVAAIALCVCAAPAAMACRASAANVTGTPGGLETVIGTWTGTSICVGNRPACKDEQVVYRFAKIEGKPDWVWLYADKIIDGARVPMYLLDMKYDASAASLTGEFERGTTRGVWAYTVSGDTMTGTVTILPDKTIGRRVSVHRAADDALPKAPPLEEYAADARAPRAAQFG